MRLVYHTRAQQSQQYPPATAVTDTSNTDEARTSVRREVRALKDPRMDPCGREDWNPRRKTLGRPRSVRTELLPRGEGRIRTDNRLLARQVHSRCATSPWYTVEESNPRPAACKTAARSTELTVRSEPGN